SSVHLHQLLETYFKEPILSKREQQVIKEKKINAILTEVKETFGEIEFWIDELKKKKVDTRWIMQLIEKEPDDFRRLLQTIEKAFMNLPSEAERLPMFSQRITGDPHAFDLHTNVGRVFLHLLAVHQMTDDVEVPVAKTSTEEINQLLGEYH